MQMRLSLYHMKTCIWYFYRKDKKVCWFPMQMNDAQDNPYLNKDSRESEQRKRNFEFSESPWNLRVCLPKDKTQVRPSNRYHWRMQTSQVPSEAQATGKMRLSYRTSLQLCNYLLGYCPVISLVAGQHTKSLSRLEHSSHRVTEKGVRV